MGHWSVADGHIYCLSQPLRDLDFFFNFLKEKKAVDQPGILFMSTPQKRPRSVQVFRSCCRELVCRVVTTFDEEKDLGVPHISLNRPRDRAADALGVSRASIFRLLREDAILMDAGESEERDRGMAMEEHDAIVIRPALVALILDQKPVTLDLLLAKIKVDNPEWPWSRATLHRALVNRCGITFRRRADTYYQKLKEDPTNVMRRALYLKYMFQYEHEGRPFIFMDESWMNKNMVPSRCWTDGGKDCELDVPPGKGPRWIIIGAGGLGGWVHESFVMWKGNVKSEDYHTEMDAQVFEHWFHNKLLPFIPRNSCVVLDRAPYHKMLTEESKVARNTWNKERVAAWLVAHGAKDELGVALSTDMLLNEETLTPNASGRVSKRRGWSKQAMMALATAMKPKPQYMVNAWARKWNELHGTDIVVHLLPVAHPILNPIELMWGQIKQFVRQRNTDFDMEAVRRLTIEKRDAQGSEEWQHSMEHTRKYAVAQWIADEMLLQEAEKSPEQGEDNDDTSPPE